MFLEKKLQEQTDKQAYLRERARRESTRRVRESLEVRALRALIHAGWCVVFIMFILELIKY